MVRNILNEAAKKLVNSPTPLLDARVLLASAAGRENAALIFSDLTNEERQTFDKYIEMRRSGMPVAYILKSKEFMGFSFYVDENTLIPRPDTERLVEKVLEEKKTAPKILDLCTGSGCIGISLALMIENSNAVLADISSGAIFAAQKNIEIYGLESRVKAVKIDILSDDISEKYDIITANPPYIPTDIAKKLEVSKSEPFIALDGGCDGLKFYRAIVKKAYAALKKDGLLAVEIGYDQKEAVCALSKNYFPNVSAFKDYGENDRVVLCKKDSVS